MRYVRGKQRYFLCSLHYFSIKYLFIKLKCIPHLIDIFFLVLLRWVALFWIWSCFKSISIATISMILKQNLSKDKLKVESKQPVFMQVCALAHHASICPAGASSIS